MSRVYERILAFDYGTLDVDACLARWKPLEEQERIGAQVFAGTKFADLGVKSVRAKFVDRETQRARLEDLRARWPQIRERLAAQLLPAAEVERRLRVVGAPAEPEEIGSTREATLADARRTIYMRDRYMALDLLDIYDANGCYLLICKVRETFAREELLNEKGKLDFAKYKPVLFEPGFRYLRTGDVIEPCVAPGKAFAAEQGID